MGFQLHEPTEVIDVGFVPMLIYGPPGIGKTSLGQTTNNPLTLDFDRGIHRASNRRRAIRFDAWSDCVEAGEQGVFAPYQTLVIDTGGGAINSMIPEVLKESGKNGYQGNLSPQGWGVVGGRFNTWMKVVRSWGKDLIMICHQDEQSDAAGNPYFKPEFPGKMAYKEVHKSFDLIGQVRHEGKIRWLDFSPSENRVGKNAAMFEPIRLPDLVESPTFLADLLARAKLAIGQTAEASAALAQTVETWREWLASTVQDSLDNLNTGVPDLLTLKNGVKKQVGHLIKAHADAHGWEFDRVTKLFVPKAKATEVTA